MSKIKFTEDKFEDDFIRKIRQLGYDYVPGQEIVRSSLKSPLADDVLKESLIRINPDLSYEVIDAAIQQIKHIDAGLLEVRNETFFDYLQNGIAISHYTDNHMKTDIVYLIDYDSVDNNSFIVSNQFRLIGRDRKRPDIVIFVNTFGSNRT